MFRSITGLDFDATGLATGLEASILPDYIFFKIDSGAKTP